MSNILIEANNINKVYDPDIYLKRGKNFYALRNVNFVLEEGDFTCIMGPSGSGKSTLLNCLSTLDSVSSGHILLKGTDMTTLRKDDLCEFRYQTLGFVFQDHNLIPYLTIFDNIASPSMLANVKMDALKEKVFKLAKELEIDSLLDKFPSECSGGECQRVAIARALINDPEIIFCDEPTGNLDSKNSHKVLSILSKLNQQGTTILLVTHDAMIASYAKDMMYLYDGGIKTVIHRQQASQIEFYQKINEIVAQDSILQQFSSETIDIQPITSQQDHEVVEAIKINDTKKEFVSRQNVYMVVEGEDYDQKAYSQSTPMIFHGQLATYHNMYNDEITIDMASIKDIHLDLRSQFLNFGIASTHVFYILVDMVSDEGTYQFFSKNKDDMIAVFHYFQKLNIPLHDPRHIIETYQQYPRDYERQKYYFRTHKDLMEYGKYNTVNPVHDYLKNKKGNLK